MIRSHVYDAIDTERNHQDAKWGPVDRRGHEVGAWLLLMDNALRKAKEAWASADTDANALDEVRQMAGLAVACGEQHGLPQRRESDYQRMVRTSI